MPCVTSLSLIITTVRGNVSISKKLQFFSFPSSENMIGCTSSIHKDCNALSYALPQQPPLTHNYLIPLKDTETLENYVDRWKLHTLLHVHPQYTEERKLTLRGWPVPSTHTEQYRLPQKWCP